MDDKLSIRINIGDKYYPMRINRDEEELIRKAAKIINDKLTQYRTKYAEREMVDLLAMTALQYTKNYLVNETENNLSHVNDEIRQINVELEDYINQNK
ncbi:MAG: cell division protein ZapA [Bacteroidales bacterium]|nr:cell division protein ZapA [Bacteroidales bacterium]